MQIKTYTFTSDELTAMINDAKSAYLNAIEKEGIINGETKNKLIDYCIVIKDKNFFGTVWSKIWHALNHKKNNVDSDLYHVVKVVDIHTKKDDENTQ
jgi:hypothetical protein